MSQQTIQVYQVLIKAPAQQIWDALTRPEFTSRYFYGVRVETTGEPGTPFRHLSDTGEVLVDAQVLAADPPHRLAVSWRPLHDPEAAGEPASRVTFEIAEHAPGVCLLTTTHDELEHSPNTARGVQGIGWTTVLSGLKTLLETGEPLLPAR